MLIEESVEKSGTSHSLIRIHYIRPVDPGGVKVVALMISINRSPFVHSLPSIASERDGIQVQAMELQCSACKTDKKESSYPSSAILGGVTRSSRPLNGFQKRPLI
ncbi:hypothetical protein NPIL_494031 [Nephila pilipes]|uniref:Uncharacterized protein n=1 Tax=Nephila pilipes TaxID=299642 RepID=A0A8X6Q392_NEPPI|nr:hypothetical protein NPIL_494031 [Nephila pilipes]